MAASFLSPYLNYSGDTRRALDRSPFAWTSGEVILWKDGLGLNSTVERLGPLYHFQTSAERLSLPRLRNPILDMPISAPDDNDPRDTLRTSCLPINHPHP